jgi:hypothetical protein
VGLDSAVIAICFNRQFQIELGQEAVLKFSPSRLLKNGTGRKLPSFRSFLSEAV